MTPLNSQKAWHQLSSEETLDTLGVTENGLNTDSVGSRQIHYGANLIPHVKRRSAFIRFLRQFHNILIYVLIGSALVTALLAHWVDTFVIMAVVIANAIIGFVQEGKAERAMNAIRQMLAPHATVIRNGTRMSVDGSSLVPGDIVFVEAGDKIPADIRVIKAHSLTVLESILTGESVPVEKDPAPITENVPLGDRSSMLYSGTIVSGGQGTGVVVATGLNTEIGRISHLISEVEELTTPLVYQMGQFARWLTLLILVIAALLLFYGFIFGHQEFSEIFMAVVGLSVAAIPEGLPAVMTITLAVGVQAMARQHAIVRRLPAIETLGSVSVICSDKTGTLTRNEMMVGSVMTANYQFDLDGQGYAPKGAISINGQPIEPQAFKSLFKLARAAALCNDAALRHVDDQWFVEGDPMEGALLAFAHKVSVDPQLEQKESTRVHTIPFDARFRMMATVHQEGNRKRVYAKGAPEQILAMCQHQMAEDGQSEPIQIDQWIQRAESTAAQGQRVLALAYAECDDHKTPGDSNDLCQHLIMIGLVGLIDPPRTEAIEAVAACQQAGIRVKMITGDHAKTAAAIANQIGLKNSTDVLTGANIDLMDDSMLAAAVLNCDIFARTSPEHKLRLVMALQSHQLVVAMTGDGVNDAPALKRADAGIAMGKNGSEAAKEAADLVLADDNFATIAAAVRQGRTVYENIKKVLSWTLPTNAGEAGAVIVAILLGMSLPVTPIQILWINLITAITLGLALAFEPPELNTMQRPPRSRHEALLSGELIWHIILVAALFVMAVYGIYHYALERGHSVDMARTLALNTLVVLEIFHLFFIRNINASSLGWQSIRATKVVWSVVGIVVSAQLAVTYWPVLQSIFSTEAMTLIDGMIILAIGALFFSVIEIEKRLRYLIKGLSKS